MIDNSVDEALVGHANEITVTIYEDGSLSVKDNGRGMPVDIHPEHGQCGIEIILTKLHAGGKFSDKNYPFSGGLHSVGISVVNALSKRVEVCVERDSKYHKWPLKTVRLLQDWKLPILKGLNITRVHLFDFGLMKNISIIKIFNQTLCIF